MDFYPLVTTDYGEIEIRYGKQDTFFDVDLN